MVAILVVPYVTKTTEVAMRNVPTAYREGGEALGMRSGHLLRTSCCARRSRVSLPA